MKDNNFLFKLYIVWKLLAKLENFEFLQLKHFERGEVFALGAIFCSNRRLFQSGQTFMNLPVRPDAYSGQF